MNRFRFALAVSTFFLVLSGCAGAIDSPPGSQQAGTSDVGRVSPSVRSRINVELLPRAASVTPGGSLTFEALVTGLPAGSSAGVVWSVSQRGGGRIGAATGAYQAPPSPGTFTVVATSVADPTTRATATVTVTEVPVITVRVTPVTATLQAGGCAAFSATVSGAAPGQSTPVTWSVQPAGAGNIEADGTYTAPAAAGVYSVIATSAADPTRHGSAQVTVTAPPPISSVFAQLQVLATKKIYFAHNSVGAEVLGTWGLPNFPAVFGLKKLLADHPGSGLHLAQVSTAAAFTPGTWAENTVGINDQPEGKPASFDQTMRGGNVPGPDLAMMKFCYVDWNAATDVAGIFATYQSTLASLAADFPATTFVHFTVPLGTGTSAAWDCDQNQVREQFSALIRAHYPANRIFDFAAIESMNADGTASTCTGANGPQPSLSADWAGDSGHLNAAGADLLAQKLVAFLANL